MDRTKISELQGSVRYDSMEQAKMQSLFQALSIELATKPEEVMTDSQIVKNHQITTGVSTSVT
jgi:hypothetical protein